MGLNGYYSSLADTFVSYCRPIPIWILIIIILVITLVVFAIWTQLNVIQISIFLMKLKYENGCNFGTLSVCAMFL